LNQIVDEIQLSIESNRYLDLPITQPDPSLSLSQRMNESETYLTYLGDDRAMIDVVIF